MVDHIVNKGCLENGAGMHRIMDEHRAVFMIPAAVLRYTSTVSMLQITSEGEPRA